MIYFFVLTLTLYFVFRYDICKKKKGLVLSYKLLLILAVLIMGCRYVVGGEILCDIFDISIFIRNWGMK